MKKMMMMMLLMLMLSMLLLKLMMMMMMMLLLLMMMSHTSRYNDFIRVIGDEENYKISLQSGLELMTTCMVDEVLTNLTTEAG